VPDTDDVGAAVAEDGSAAGQPVEWRVRWFVSREYFSLWVAQVISALGDWVGLVAISALAANISGEPEAATALVLTARVAPSFVLGPVMGLITDRYDRKRLMRIADIARALVFVALPFLDEVWHLIVASFLLEVFTLLWSPAKEALVPALVPRERLTTANSLGVLAAYGTFPIAAGLLLLLSWGNSQLAEISWLEPLGFARNLGKAQALAFYFNALTFLVVVFIVWRFVHTPGVPRARVATPEGEVAPTGIRHALTEVREGWSFILANPVVRAVNLGLAAGLLGGAMLVPLGPTFAKTIIGDVDAYFLYIAALGVGVAIGVALLTAFQNRIPKAQVFVATLFFAGGSILFGVSMSTFWLSALGVFGLGLGAGAVYVLGYTLLHENTEDELRGRTFTTFLTLVRLCVLGAMVLGPTLSRALNPVMERWVSGRTTIDLGEGVTVTNPSVAWFGVEYSLPGVRITLWLGGAMILLAAVIAARSIQIGLRQNFRALGSDLRDAGRVVRTEGTAQTRQERAASRAAHPSSRVLSVP